MCVTARRVASAKILPCEAIAVGLGILVGFFVEPFERTGYIARRFRTGGEDPGSADRSTAGPGVATYRRLLPREGRPGRADWSVSVDRWRAWQRAIAMAKRLYVGNLKYTVTSEHLQELFEQFGAVSSAQVLSDRETGRSRGFGFVEMPNDDEAQAAIETLDGQDHDGRRLTVNEARPRTPGGGGGGGGYRGGGGGGGYRGGGGYGDDY